MAYRFTFILIVVFNCFFQSACENNHHLLSRKVITQDSSQTILQKSEKFKKWILDSSFCIKNNLVLSNPVFDSVHSEVNDDSTIASFTIFCTEYISSKKQCVDSLTRESINILKSNNVLIAQSFKINICYSELYSLSMLENFLFEKSYEYCNIQITPERAKYVINYTLIKGDLTDIDTVFSR